MVIDCKTCGDRLQSSKQLISTVKLEVLLACQTTWTFFPVSKYFWQKACLGTSSATAVIFSKGKRICQIRVMFVLEFSNILGQLFCSYDIVHFFLISTFGASLGYCTGFIFSLSAL